MKTEVHDKKGAHQPEAWQAAESSKPQAGKEDMMKKMEAAGAPGPAHKALHSLEGNWKAEVKCWMDPSAPPQTSQATAKANMVLNGRFLEEEFHGQMMGKPFTGRMLLGFDNIKQTFNSAWMSDAQTSMFVSEGKADCGNKVITLEGKANCPVSDRRDFPMKTVLRLDSAERHVLEMYDGSRKTMEITYTRQ